MKSDLSMQVSSRRVAKQLVILLLLATAAVAFAEGEVVPIEPIDDFSPGLGIFALFMIVIVLALLGFGMVCAVIFMLSVGVAIAFGIISTSTLLAFYKRRFSSGLRALHYQICAVVVLPAGIA